MKIEKSASSLKKITMSKAEWLHIGKQAGWIKTARESRWERSESDDITVVLSRNLSTNECMATFKWPKNDWGDGGEDGYRIDFSVFEKAKESEYFIEVISEGSLESIIFDYIGLVKYSVEGVTTHIGWNDPDESKWMVHRYLLSIDPEIRTLLGDKIIKGLELELDDTTYDAS